MSGGPHTVGQSYRGNLLGTIITILKQVVGFLSWLWDTLKAGISWLQNAMPGAKKDAAGKVLQKDLDTVAKQNDLLSLVYKGNGQYVGTDKQGGTKTYGISDDRSGSLVPITDLLAKTNITKTKLEDAQSKFDKAPSMFDDLISAINGLKEAILGAGKTAIANTVAPVTTPAMNAANNYLNDQSKNFNDTWDKTNGNSFLSTHSVKTPLETLGEWTYGKISGNGDDDNAGKNSANTISSFIASMTSAGLTKDKIRENLAGAGYSDSDITAAGYASGASFSKSGLFVGNVHAPEEIPPLATAIKGPGILARAIDSLGKAQQYGGVGGRSSISQDTYIIDASQHIDRVESEIDVAKMQRVMRSELDSIYTKKARQAGS